MLPQQPNFTKEAKASRASRDPRDAAHLQVTVQPALGEPLSCFRLVLGHFTMKDWVEQGVH